MPVPDLPTDRQTFIEKAARRDEITAIGRHPPLVDQHAGRPLPVADRSEELQTRGQLRGGRCAVAAANRRSHTPSGSGRSAENGWSGISTHINKSCRLELAPSRPPRSFS
jgi:hypothetical protein